MKKGMQRRCRVERCRWQTESSHQYRPDDLIRKDERMKGWKKLMKLRNPSKKERRRILLRLSATRQAMNIVELAPALRWTRCGTAGSDKARGAEGQGPTWTTCSCPEVLWRMSE